MRKDTKNEPVPQVIKANAQAIHSRIESNCSEIPLKFDFERTGINPITNTRPSELDIRNKPFLSTPWSYNVQRSQFIYGVIHTHSYYLAEGNRLNVSDNEIFTTFTKLAYSLEEIEQLTHRKEFDKYLYKCYQQVLAEEDAERTEYDDANLLGKLLMSLSTPERLWKRINEETRVVKSTDAELRALVNQLICEEIEGTTFTELRKPIKERNDYARGRQAHYLNLCKKMKETGKYRFRHRVKMLFASSCQTSRPRPECTTITLCEFYIDEYCSWFNRTFKAEIAETCRLEKLAKRKQKRLENKKSDPRLDVLRPFLNSGLSEQRIAERTGIPKSTVNRLMKKLV